MCSLCVIARKTDNWVYLPEWILHKPMVIPNIIQLSYFKHFRTENNIIILSDFISYKFVDVLAMLYWSVMDVYFIQLNNDLLI